MLTRTWHPRPRTEVTRIRPSSIKAKDLGNKAKDRGHKAKAFKYQGQGLGTKTKAKDSICQG